MTSSTTTTTTTTYLFDTDGTTVFEVLNRFTGQGRGDIYFLELWHPRNEVNNVVQSPSPSPSPSPMNRTNRSRRSNCGKRKRFPLVYLKRFPSVGLVGPYEREALIGPFHFEDGKRHLTEFKRLTRTEEESSQYALELLGRANVLRWIQPSAGPVSLAATAAAEAQHETQDHGSTAIPGISN